MKICTDRMSKLPGKYLLTIFVASLIAIPSAHARLTAQHSQLWSQDSPGIPGVMEGGDWFGRTVSACDFNNDGQDDLAIAAPLEDIGTLSSAGAVNIIYGGNTNTGKGLSPVNAQLLTLSFGAPLNLSPQASDYFGRSLASGDFDGDEYCDLAVGVPLRDIEGKTNAGAVYIIYGDDPKLDENRKQFLYQSPILGGNPEEQDQFGFSLAAGDFNGDGKDDLAVGVPRESIGSTDSAGLVMVIYGHTTGLYDRGAQGWTQGSELNGTTPQDRDFFGSALAAGDFNGDGKDDLAVSVSGEDVGGIEDAGLVHVIYGSAARLNAAGSQLWGQGKDGILETPDQFDHFGRSLATGDFDGNGKDDLAVGVPQEHHIHADNEGVVQVIYAQNSSGGLSSVGNQLFIQGADLKSGSEEDDQFGESLTVGDFNADGKDDLVVGVPHEDFKGIDDGVLHVLYGSAARLSSTGHQLWSPDGEEGSGDILGEPTWLFGHAIAAGDFDGNGKDDLAASAWSDVTMDARGGGEVSVIYAMKDYGSFALSAVSQVVSEGEPVNLTVTRTGGSQENTGVILATASGSASNGVDYTALGLGLPFADGEIQKVGQISTIDDGLIENQENFWVSLSDPWGGATLAPGETSLLITILDKQSCPAGQVRYEVPAPKSYPGKFYCAASEYVKAGDWTGGDLGVIVESSGWLMYSAPNIYLYPGFRVEAGGELHLGYPIHP